MRFAENTGRKNYAKNRHLLTIAQLCRSVFSQLRHVSTIGKNLLNSITFPTCPHNMGNFGPLTDEIGLGVWAPQQISTGFASCLRCCTDVAHRRPSKLYTTFGHLLGWYTIYKFSGALAPLTEFCQVQYSLYVQVCILPYWQRYFTALQQQASAILGRGTRSGIT